MPSFEDLPTEIEIYLLGFLADNKKALFSTVRVSQAWHRYTVDLLWRRSSANNLADVEEPRRQHYANRLVKLEVTKLWYFYQFRFLSFPDLVEVSLGKNNSPKDDRLLGTVWISPYLQPSLRKLCLTGSFFLTEHAMDLICLSCPLLEDLELASQFAFTSPNGCLLHSSFNFPKLRRLVYSWGMFASRSAMKRMSEQLPVLEYLEITAHDLDLWRGASEPVFPQLKTLFLGLFSRPSIPDLYVR